jgi:hypothetical protein
VRHLDDDSLEGVGLLSSWLDRLFLLGPDQEFLRRIRQMGSPPPPVLLLEAVAQTLSQNKKLDETGIGTKRGGTLRLLLTRRLVHVAL